MGLPKIKFNIAKTGLGLIGGLVQKVPGFIITGVAFGDAVLGAPYQVFSLDRVEEMGITAESNPFAHQHISDFYASAGEGAELYFMLVSDATTYDQMADNTEDLAKKLISFAGGRIRVLGLLKKSTGAEVLVEGFDVDVKAGIVKAQALAEAFAAKYMPFRIVISGNRFSGLTADLFDYKTAEYDRVCMLIANNDGAAEASVGLALGRLASIPTQRSIARVKDGSAIALQAFFTDGSIVEDFRDEWDFIHDKGYTFFRDFPGRSGYYFTDDQTLCKPDNDFSSLARGLVMDEAVLIANDTLTEELSDEIPVTEAGNIHPAIIKTWQTNIEKEITALMVSVGKLNGVRAFIDENQGILTSDKFQVQLFLQPVGYAKEIEVNIGYTTNLEA